MGTGVYQESISRINKTLLFKREWKILRFAITNSFLRKHVNFFKNNSKKNQISLKNNFLFSSVGWTFWESHFAPAFKQTPQTYIKVRPKQNLNAGSCSLRARNRRDGRGDERDERGDERGDLRVPKSPPNLPLWSMSKIYWRHFRF